MLTDTGPLIALLDENDKHHAACVSVARKLPRQPLMTTWLCFTEAIYFLGEEGGYSSQNAFGNCDETVSWACWNSCLPTAIAWTP